MSARLIVADVLVGLSHLEPESVQCVVTSPPYWGLRDYGVAGQLGLEATPRDYLIAMRRVFRAVRRVLRRDGTLWLNLGDCYATGAGRVGDAPGGGEQGARWRGEVTRQRDERRRRRPAANGRGEPQDPGAFTAVGPITQPNRMPLAGLKPKDLVGMPWRVALMLQRDGWWLRSDIIWSKPNPMPESIKDRPTRSHEYLFLLTRSRRYYYDADAIAEAAKPEHLSRYDYPFSAPPEGATIVPGDPKGQRTRPSGMRTPTDSNRGKNADSPEHNGHRRIIANMAEARANGAPHDSPFGPTRNRRTVWEIPTQPFPEAHFATFPEALVEPCILAGSSQAGACSTCGVPLKRLVIPGAAPAEPDHRNPGKRLKPGQSGNADDGNMGFRASRLSGREMNRWRTEHPNQAGGWFLGCGCKDSAVRPCLVLDPFAGSGTVGLVADRLGRDFVGVELNPAYAAIAERRLVGDSPLFASVTLTSPERTEP